jgi:excisionase family DNA binding protein
MLNHEEAASYLRISRSTLYKLTSSRSIPHYKPGGKLVYFKPEDLDRWLESNRVETDSELQSAAQAAILSNKTYKVTRNA